MDILLDTHALVWLITEDPDLLPTAIKQIENPKNRCFVSIATHWELSIKYSLGRMDLNQPLETIFRIVEESGFLLLPISIHHILKTARLPFHHRDPFDRLLIGQAKEEGMTLMSRDKAFLQYEVPLLWE